MRYTPYTEAQIQSMNVIEPGVYTFQILEVLTTDSIGSPLRDKNGNDMAKLKLLIWDNQNRERTLFTFVSGDGKFAYKLRHLAKAIGKLLSYEDGSFRIEDCVGSSGKADVVIKKGTLKNDSSGEMWADRNDIKDFIPHSDTPAPAQNHGGTLQQPSNNLVDDEIPF